MVLYVNLPRKAKLMRSSYVNSSYLKQSYKNTSELIKTDDKISIVKSPFEN